MSYFADEICPNLEFDELLVLSAAVLLYESELIYGYSSHEKLRSTVARLRAELESERERRRKAGNNVDS